MMQKRADSATVLKIVPNQGLTIYKKLLFYFLNATSGFIQDFSSEVDLSEKRDLCSVTICFIFHCWTCLKMGFCFLCGGGVVLVCFVLFF